MGRPAPIALVRPPGPSFTQAQSTHPDRQSLDYEQALHQHGLYSEALTHAGFKVQTLPCLPDFPDSTFIEDNAVILNGSAWLCHNRAPTRQGEAQWTGQELAHFIKVGNIDPTTHLDGGDVLVTDQKIFVGLSSRTSESALPALEKATTLPVQGVAVTAGLHLKSAVTWLGQGKILIDPFRVDTIPFRDLDWIEVPTEETYAANALSLGNTVVMAEGFFGTQSRLEKAGWQVVTVPMNQFEKADGGITCLSLILPENN